MLHRPGEFEPDEQFDAVALGEAVEATFAMLDDPLDQVRGEAGVKRPVPRARHDIGAWLKVAVHVVEARAAMDPGSRRTSQRASFAGDKDWCGTETSLCIAMPDLIRGPASSGD